MMNPTTGRIGALLSVLILAGSARADEKEIPLSEVPKAVVDAIKAKFPKAEMKEASKETEDGKTTYEVETKVGEMGVDVHLTADGKFLEIEEEVALKDMPKIVTETVMAKYPKATMQKAEKTTAFKDGGETMNYELALTTADKVKREVVVSAAGKIQKDEKDDEDEKEDKDEKNEKKDK